MSLRIMYINSIHIYIYIYIHNIYIYILGIYILFNVYNYIYMYMYTGNAISLASPGEEPLKKLLQGAGGSAGCHRLPVIHKGNTKNRWNMEHKLDDI